MTVQGLDLHFVPDKSVQKHLIALNVRLAEWSDFSERADIIAGCQRRRKVAQQKCSVMDDACRHEVPFTAVGDKNDKSHTRGLCRGDCVCAYVCL